MATELHDPLGVLLCLRNAMVSLEGAHRSAGEREGDRTDLIGPVRDMIFGLNSAVEGLISLIEERYGEMPSRPPRG